jgi:hypothetical protein
MTGHEGRQAEAIPIDALRALFDDERAGSGG